jgi:hypothetical protein
MSARKATIRTRQTIKTVVSAMALAAAALSLPPAAAQDPREAVARVSHGAAGIDWQPLVEYERLVLTVSRPDGQVMHQEFAASERPSFGLFDRAGNALPDGVYNYELRAVPRFGADVEAALARARETGDEAPLAALRAAGRLPAGAVQSGTFAIRGGAFVSADQDEPGAALATRATPREPGLALRDQVIPDDLIVQGSLCTGFDCVNNENFGFDTIRLKENNLRIHFEDTSVGTFPTNDWTLIANDSASGGQSKFSIEDRTGAKIPFTVEAGATTNSVYVDSTGRVGFRTSTPVLDLHVATSNTPALRLEQNSSGGFTAQTWDVAGNEANFFVRDVTGGSRLSFRIRPGAPTSSIDIAADGDVGIGDGSPDDRLDVDVSGSTTGGITIQHIGTGSGTGLPQLSLDDASAGQVWRFRVNNAAQFVFTDGTNSKSPVVVFSNSDTNLLRIGGTNADVADPNRVTVTGELFLGATQVIPDYVFEPDYRLQSIEEHAAYMWEKKHLPAVGAAIVQEDGTYAINVGAHQVGILEELEKAHIYIEQLHTRLEEKDAELADLARRLERLEASLAQPSGANR